MHPVLIGFFSNIRNKRQVINTWVCLKRSGPDAFNLHQLFYHLDGNLTDIII